MAGLRAVLFDFGDTLFHSPSGPQVMVEAGVDPIEAERVWTEIWTSSKAPAALALQRDVSPPAHRAGWLTLFRPAERLAPGLGETLYERVMTVENWSPYPDAPVVLAALEARGVACGVVSNVASDLRPAFRRHGLERHVQAFVHSFELGLEKPDPRLFLSACEAMGASAAETLMVGDSHLGDGGAVLAGLTVLLLPAVPPGRPRGLDLVLGLV